MRGSSLLGFFFLVVCSYGQGTFIKNENSVTDYTFDPAKVLRDPFLPSTELSKRNVNELITYELTQMNLVAILTGMGAPKAMLLLPNRNTHIVQIGDTVGRRSGRVSKITEAELQVRESFTDYKGRKKSNTVSLLLAQ